jgi:predicted signal transduction protein with EAL and GGDEF domain
VWVNVSVRQLREKFAGELAGVLVAHGLGGADLGIEVTETVELDDDDHVLEQLRFVRLLGVGVALDDFGTGYSSLAALKRQGFDVVKIDRSLTVGARDAFGAALVRAAVDVAHAMGAAVLAEGVETPEQLPHLCASGVDSVAGFALERPLWPEDVPVSIARNLITEGLIAEGLITESPIAQGPEKDGIPAGRGPVEGLPSRTASEVDRFARGVRCDDPVPRPPRGTGRRPSRAPDRASQAMG